MGAEEFILESEVEQAQAIRVGKESVGPCKRETVLAAKLFTPIEKQRKVQHARR